MDALPVDSGAYSCALALDTVCYSVWIALLLLAVRYAKKWNKRRKGGHLQAGRGGGGSQRRGGEGEEEATSGDWIFLIGLSLLVSALSQMVRRRHVRRPFQR